MFSRTRYQYGSLTPKTRSRGESVWELRYYDTDSQGRRQRRTVTIGTMIDYPTESAARRCPLALATLMKINAEQPRPDESIRTFGALLARYEQEEMPERYSTRAGYQSCIKNHIRPRWAAVPLDDVKAMTVEDWLESLPLAPKTKSHLKALMHLVFTCGQRWEVVEKNPIQFVRVAEGGRRQQQPMILTVEQFNGLLPHIREPYRTMVLIAGCLGLRVSEISALKWDDFDFDNERILIQRSIVHGRIGQTKTEYSHDHVPLDSLLASRMLSFKAAGVENVDGWVFANPVTGRPYHQEQIQKTHLRNAGIASGLGGVIGWHTFRHSYRSWLDDGGAPMTVQKELMRHASIQTTMNVYGRAMPDSKREANRNVVKMLISDNQVGARTKAKRQTGG